MNRISVAPPPGPGIQGRSGGPLLTFDLSQNLLCSSWLKKLQSQDLRAHGAVAHNLSYGEIGLGDAKAAAEAVLFRCYSSDCLKSPYILYVHTPQTPQAARARRCRGQQRWL